MRLMGSAVPLVPAAIYQTGGSFLRSATITMLRVHHVLSS